jgi:hypothetical protein
MAPVLKTCLIQSFQWVTQSIVRSETVCLWHVGAQPVGKVRSVVRRNPSDGRVKYSELVGIFSAHGLIESWLIDHVH